MWTLTFVKSCKGISNTSHTSTSTSPPNSPADPTKQNINRATGLRPALNVLFVRPTINFSNQGSARAAFFSTPPQHRCNSVLPYPFGQFYSLNHSQARALGTQITASHCKSLQHSLLKHISSSWTHHSIAHTRIIMVPKTVFIPQTVTSLSESNEVETVTSFWTDDLNEVETVTSPYRGEYLLIDQSWDCYKSQRFKRGWDCYKPIPWRVLAHQSELRLLQALTNEPWWWKLLTRTNYTVVEWWCLFGDLLLSGQPSGNSQAVLSMLTTGGAKSSRDLASHTKMI